MQTGKFFTVDGAPIPYVRSKLTSDQWYNVGSLGSAADRVISNKDGGTTIQNPVMYQECLTLSGMSSAVWPCINIYFKLGEHKLLRRFGMQGPYFTVRETGVLVNNPSPEGTYEYTRSTGKISFSANPAGNFVVDNFRGVGISPTNPYANPLTPSHAPGNFYMKILLLWCSDNRMIIWGFGSYGGGLILDWAFSAIKDFGNNYDLTTFVWEDDAPPPERDDFMDRYSARVGAVCKSYFLSKQQLRNFMKDLNTKTIIDSFITMVYGDATNAVLGCNYFYGLRREAQDLLLGSTENITMGNITFNQQSGLVKVFGNEFCIKDLGTITAPDVGSDFTAVSRTDYVLVAPFVGCIPLQATDLYKVTATSMTPLNIQLRYKINITNGSCLCEVRRPDDGVILFSQSCQYGYEIPFTINQIKSLGNYALGAVRGNLVSSTGVTYQSGSIDSDAAIMSDFTARLVASKNETIKGTNQDAYIGKPTTYTGKLGGLVSGYVKITEAKGFTSAVPAVKTDAILTMLKNGVYI